MIREVIPFTTEEAWLQARAKDITSTSVSALFGVSPYLSKFELWHRLRNPNIELIANPQGERLRWGQRLQQAISEGVVEDKDWVLIDADEYVRIPELGIGSSFDYRGFDPNLDEELVLTDYSKLENSRFLVECKNVDSLEFRNGWLLTDFGLEAPAHIELQAQHQMLVSGIGECYIAALVGGNRLELLHRHYDEQVGTRILEEAESFWESDEPAPDFRVDSQFISRLHQYAEPGKVLDADTELTQLLAEYAQYGAEKRSAEDNQDAAKARILLKIGDAERVHSEIGTLSAGLVKAAHIEYDRKEYRSFKFSERRKK